MSFIPVTELYLRSFRMPQIDSLGENQNENTKHEVFAV